MMFNTLLSAAVVILLAATITAQQLESGDGMTEIHNKSIYHIITDAHNSDMCSMEICSNLSLSQFASNADYYISDSEMTTLMLQPGDHRLDSQLLVANVRKLSLVGKRETNDSIVNILCSENFIFQNVTELHIEGIQFIHCTDNYIDSVERLIIDNCTFDGQNHNGTVLNVINTTGVNITRCLFIHTYGSYKQILTPYPSIVGIASAIISISSNIDVHNSVFERNVGMILFAEQSSNLSLNNCTFSNNVYLVVSQVHSSYYYSNTMVPVLAFQSSSVITISDSVFENICVFSVEPLLSSLNSGIMEVYESSVSIQSSIFRRNTISHGFFIVGFDSNITINEVLMENNTAIGAIMGRNRSSSISAHLQIYNSTFVNNNFHHSTVFAYFLLVQVHYSNFINNQYYGETNTYAIIAAFQCNATISHSAFVDNFAFSVVQMYTAKFTISISTFLRNRNDIGVIYLVLVPIVFLNRTSYANAILIDESTFDNNFNTNGAVVYITSDITNQGLTLISRSNFLSNRNKLGTINVNYAMIHIDRCEFTGNTAEYGAVLYAVQTTTRLSDVQISNNTASIAGVLLLYGGNITSNGLSLASNIASTAVVALTSCEASFIGNTTLTNNKGSFYAVASTVRLEGNVSISNNMPSHNQIIPLQEGGAVTSFQSSVQVNGVLSLINNSADNGGAMFISESRFLVNGDITISKNKAKQSGGGIHLYQSRLNIQGTCSISNNIASQGGGGIYAVSSTVTLEDRQGSLTVTSLTFHSNQAKHGGAFFLSTNTRVYTLLIASSVHQIHFIENTADYGGALYVEDQTNTGLCNSSSSTECFFQILALYPDNLEYVVQQQIEALNFSQNSATYVGDAIFGGLLDRCTVSQLNPLRQQGIVQQGLEFIQSVSNIDNIDLIVSHPVRLCFCIENHPNCSNTPLPTYVRKGETFKLSIVAVDQVNHTLESNVTAFISSPDGGLKEGQQQQSVGTNCTDVTYNVITPHDSEELLLNAVGPCGDAYASQRRVQLVFINCTCPIGFQTRANVESNCECECHSNITDYIRLETCNSSTESFETKLNAWISYTNITGQNVYYLLTHSNCPYDFCKSETEQVVISLNNLNDINRQCDLNRAGVLCGVCQSGYSVSFGSSRCIKCGKHWFIALLGLIVLAIIAGIALVGILLFLNVTVAIGTINGILFYANIINGNASIFFNDLPIPSFPSVFIAWLNLNIGFDVCLFDGMDTFAKTLLQLFFPAYLNLLVFTVIVVSKYSQRFSNMIGKKGPNCYTSYSHFDLVC